MFCWCSLKWCCVNKQCGEQKKSLITPHFFYTAAKRYKIISEAVFNNVHYIHNFMVCKNCKFARKKFISINILVFFLIFAFCVLFDNFTSLQDFQQTRDLNFDTTLVLNKWYDTLILQTKKKKTHKIRCFPFCKTICTVSAHQKSQRRYWYVFVIILISAQPWVENLIVDLFFFFSSFLCIIW